MKSALQTLLRQREFSVFAMLILVAVYLSFSSEYFLSQRNLMNIGRQASVVAIVALGQALVIIARGIDLSVGSVMGFSAVCSALVMRATGSDMLAILVGLGAGVLAGVLNGTMVTKLRINPFIATLGMLSVARGVALLMTGGIPVPYTGWAEWLGAGRVGGVPVSVLLMFIMVAVVHVVATRSVTGREIYAVGDNPKAARLAGTTRDQIIRDMTGKQALFEHRHRDVDEGAVALRMTDVSDGRHIAGVSLDVYRGEIFGLFGLVGAGRTELLELICGARRTASGQMTLFDTPHTPANPSRALRSGVTLVPEGRKIAGILPQHSVRRNASVASLRDMGGGLMVSARQEAAQTDIEFKALAVRMSDDRQPITTLSGGNQQKVIFARALLPRPRLLLLDEPTHGVDIGAKSEIYEIIRRAADAGLTVIIASSELPEITALCDRVAVLSKGRLAGVLKRNDMDEAHLLRLAFSEYGE